MFYCTKVDTDNRGNQQLVVDRDHSHEVTVWEYPQRGGIAEVPGDQEIKSTRIGFSLVDDAGEVIDNFGIKAEVEFRGEVWNVVTPPAYHHGTRHTRHWSCDIKGRL